MSRHGMAMVAVVRRPDLRLRELAEQIGISPRATQTIVSDLVDAGFVERRRKGRRNHYQVRGDRSLPDPWAVDHEVSDLVGALVSGPRATRPSGGRRQALVLACSDHRYQEPLRDLMAAEGLLAQAEVVLWPGGAASLTGLEGHLMLEVMSVAISAAEPPQRVVLVAHQDCHVRTAFGRGGGERLARLLEIRGRRRRSIDRVHSAFGVRPETWYITEAGARRVGGFQRSQVPALQGSGS